MFEGFPICEIFKNQIWNLFWFEFDVLLNNLASTLLKWCRIHYMD